MTAKQSKALSALLTHNTRREAAAAAGLTDRTLRSYLSDPEFLKEYKAAFAALVEDAAQQGKQILSPALTVLKEIMLDAEESAAARVSAAKAAIDFALKLSEAVDVVARVDELEKILAEVQHE